jgi:Prolyl oligopeptidase family
VPRAALQAEPALPTPTRTQWPFPSSFSRTSGTGRLAGGASLWTDWVFDDHGAAAPSGAPISPAALNSTLAPTQGIATYPAGPAKNNGADIFTAAVGLTAKASYWRVDWNTLVNDNVPIAEWTFDTDDNAKTGTSTWPAAAGVHSAGIDTALVVSAKGAELIDTTTGKSTDVVAHGGRLTVNHRVHSFIVRIPRRLLPVSGSWRIRLASGLASSDGKSFAEPDYSSGLDLVAGAIGLLPHVYNVTFRTVKQEPPIYTGGTTDAQVATFERTVAGTPVDKALGVDGLAKFITGNFWMEDHQADALASGGDVSAFSHLVNWSRLADHATTPQPQPRGYSNRWYVSRLHLGQGAIPNPTTSAAGDLKPNYLSRVQPYAVYVPRHLDLHRPTPLTWVLHSLSVNLNQYGALDPHLLQQECQARHSICATTEGFGPDGWYFDQAEQDFWSVWHALATSYRLDPSRTVISGYSMGGWASYKFGLEHPDLFSQAMPLEGPPDCGVRVLELNGQQIEAPAGAGTTGHCSKDGFSTPLLSNARWLPYDVTQGGLDELVPAPSNLQTTSDLKALGDRYTLFFLPADDHLAYATQDRFGGIVKALGQKIPRVTRNPGHIDYRWYPSLDDSKLGIGTTTAYWLTHLDAATSAPGALASVRADSLAIADRIVRDVAHGPTLVSTPLPATKTSLSWQLGARPQRKDRLNLALSQVKAITVDAARAKLTCPRVIVSSTHSVRLTLTHLEPGSVATYAGHSHRIGQPGRITLRLPAGRSTARISCG